MFQEEIMKKLLSLLLAAIMLFTLGFSAVADENDDPTTYLSIINNDYESVIMTFNVNADKFVADTATYRVFSNVCFEDVVSDQGGSAFVNIYFYDEGGKYIAHSDWASSFQPKGEDGEWNDYEFSFSTADYQGFSYATVAVGLWRAKGTVRTSSIQLSKNGEIIWNRSFSEDIDFSSPDLGAVTNCEAKHEGVTWEITRPDNTLDGYTNLCREDGVDITIVGGANEGHTDDPNVFNGKYSGSLNDGIVSEKAYVDKWFGFCGKTFGMNGNIDGQTGYLCSIKIDLGAAKDFNRVRLHYWGPETSSAGLAKPLVMRASYSNDGENWTDLGDLIPQNDDGYGWADSDVRDFVNARYVLVEYLASTAEGGSWVMVSEVEVLRPKSVIDDDSSAPAGESKPESKPADESKGGTEPTSDNGFIALALIASLAVAGAVIIKKTR